MGLATLLLATSFVVGSIAGPLSQTPESQCASTCTVGDKFQYEIGRSYIYHYEAASETHLISKPTDASNLLIKATAEVQIISKCNLRLTLRDVELRDPDRDRLLNNNDVFKSSLEENSLDFSFQDGLVNQLCPRPNEPLWVLNIKRGILSTFQNSMKTWDDNHNTDETDVTGKCATNYEINRGGWLSDSVITKTKDFYKCTDRTEHYTWIQSAPYHQSIVPQSSSLLKSTHKCTHTIRQNTLYEAVCKESHQFQPFNNENSGATTLIEQRMTFKKSEMGGKIKVVPIGPRTTLLFDHQTQESHEMAQNSFNEVFRQLCTASEQEIRPNVPQLFSQFVNALKKLSYANIEQTYNNVESICPQNKNAKKLLMDAIPLAGSNDAVSFMTNKIIEGRISNSEIDSWLTTLSLLPNPSSHMLKTSIPLLDLQGHRSKALLAISTLTHSFCKNQNQCGDEIEVANVVAKIISQMPPNCQTKDNMSIEMIITQLKALGNIGHIDQAIPMVQSCYKTIENPIEVRLAAIDAHRRMPCKNRNNDILNTYLDREEDSEVRIGAYLIAMTCPSETILDKIEERLVNEDVNQVASFVWTHLTSIQQSGNPNRAMTKKILSSKKLQKKFATDVRKFSRYYEGSMYMNSIQTGAHVDGTVIFSPKSYLPRSTNLALQLDIFGQSIDLFEMGARMEGFEQLVETFFGPQGHFPDETIHQILESYRDKKTTDQSKLNQIATIFNAKNAKPEEPRGSFYTRLFGNDVQFFRFDNLNELLQRSTNAFFNMDQLAKIMTGEEINFTKNSIILDSSLTIPTSIGLPLNLKVNGTSAVNLRMGGKLDTTQIQSKSLTVKGHIKPSAAIEINGAMLIDAFVARSGLKITTLIHTSTETEAELIVKDGQMIKSRIQMAKDKMEIFDFRSSLIVVDGDTEKELNSQELLHSQTCTGEFMSKYLGLQLCSEVIYPSQVSTPLILSGPLAASIYLQKTDKMLASYDFEYLWTREPITTKTGEIKYMRIGKLSLDTHKSSVNRELTAEFVYNEANGNISLRFISPIKKATFNGNLVNDPDHKKLDALMLVDENECLAFQSELRTETIGNKYVVTPRLAVRLNGQPVISLKGSALTQDNKKYSADFTIEHITERPITVYGLASKTERNGSPRYDIDFNVNSEMLQTYGKWFFQSSPLHMATKGTLDYKWPQEDKHSITFSVKSNTQQNSKLTKTSAEIEFQWTTYPKSNWAMTFDMQRNGDQLDNVFTLHYGGEEQRSHNMIKIEHSYRGRGSLLKHHLTTSMRVQFPPANIDTTLDIRSDITTKNLDTSVILQMTPQKKVVLTLAMLRGDESRKELISGFARLTYPNNELEVSSSVTQPEIDSIVITSTAKWAKNTQATLTVSVRNHGPIEVNSWGKELAIELHLPGQQPFIVAGDVVINNREQSAHGEAQINGRTYRTFAEYHRPSLENVRVIAGAKSPTATYSAAADMRYNDKERHLASEIIMGKYRRIKSDMQLKKDGDVRNAYVNVITDADNHPNDIYTLQMSLQKIFQGSQGMITLQMPPKNEIGLEWKSKTEGSFGNGPFTLNGQYQMWWASGKKITMDVELTAVERSSSRDITGSVRVDTPWTNAIGIYAQHTGNQKQWTNSLDIRHEKEPVLSITTDGTLLQHGDIKQLASNVKLSTTAPLLTLKIDHRWGKKLIKSNVIVNSGKSSEIRFTVYGEDKRTVDQFGFSGSIDITTQCPYVKKLGLHTNITFSQTDHVVQSLISWNNNVINADYSGQFKHQQDELSVTSNIIVRTPFRLVQFLSSNLNLNIINGSPVLMNYAFTINEQYALKWSLNKRNTNNIIGNIKVETPEGTLAMLAGSLQLSRDNSKSKLNLELNTLENQQISTNIEWSLSSLTNLHFAVSAESTLVWVPFQFELLLLSNNLAPTYQYMFTIIINGETTSLNMELTNSAVEKQTLGTEYDISGQFDLKTPFAELKKVNAMVKLLKRETTLDIQIDSSLNDKVANLKLNINALDRTSSLVINLPLESLKTITYKVKSTLHGSSRIVKESELSWIPGPTYTFITDFYMPISNLTQRHNIRMLKIPAGQGKESQTTLLEMQFDYDQAEQHDAKLSIKYKEQNLFQVSASLGPWPLQSVGTGQLSLDVNSAVFKALKVNVYYDLRNTMKSGSVKVSWNDNQPITMTVNGQINSETVNVNIDVSTPFEKYENNHLKLNFDARKMTGQLEVSVKQTDMIVSLEGQKGRNQGNYIIRLKSSLEGYQTMSLATNYDLTSPKYRRFTISGNGEKENFELELFRKIASPAVTNAGVTFTSSNPNFEKITLDYIGGGQSHALRLTKDSDLKVNATLDFNINVKSSFIKTEINSPWATASLDCILKATNEEYSSNVTFNINENVVVFVSRFQKLANGHQWHVSLKTPSESMTVTQLDGQYQLTSTTMNTNVNFAVNDFKAGLNGRVQFLEDPKILLTLTSSLPNYETITLAGKWIDKLKSKQLDASVSINGKSTAMTLTLSSELAQSIKFHLKTPFDGYKLIELTGTYQRDGAKLIVVDAELLKDQTKLKMNGRYQKKSDAQTELALNMETPFENYKTIDAALSIDTKPNKKQMLLFTMAFKKGEQYRKYQLTSELDITRPGYLEYNLKVKSPEEESRFYANYNAQGVHNFTFDIKLIKGKIMMESRGRLFASNKHHGQGSIAFNTNYNTMITANFNGMYDIQSNKKELALQSNINGVNNELMATLTKRDNSLDVDIHGECSCQQWRKFSLRGWVKNQNSARDVQLTFSRNEELFSIRGEYQKEQGDGYVFGKLTLTTPYLEHQSLEISFANRLETFAFNVTNNGEQLINAKLQTIRRDSKTTYNLDVKSVASFMESINSELSYQYSYSSVDMQFSFKSKSYNFDSNVSGLTNNGTGNIKFTIRGNINLPFINDNNLNVQLSYNMPKADFRFNVIVSSKALFDSSIKKQAKEGHYIVNLNSQMFGKIELESYYKPRNALNLNLKRNDGELLVINVISSKIDININLLKEPVGLTAFFENDELTVKIIEGDKTIEIKATLDVGKRLAKANFKSPFEGYRDLAFFASLSKAEQQGHVFNISIQSSNKPLVALNFYLNPQSPHLDVNFISSFEGYEELRLVIPSLRYGNGQMQTEIRYTKGAKTFSLIFKVSDRVAIDYKNTFVGTWRHVSLAATATSFKSVRMLFTVDDRQNLEIVFKASVMPLQSSWQLDYRNDFIKKTGPLRSLQIKGYYDLTQTDKYSLVFSFESENVKQFEAVLEYYPGKLQLFVGSTLPNLRQFAVIANFRNTQKENEVKISINLNDKSWTTTGRVENTNDGFVINVKNDFQVAGIREVKLRTKRDVGSTKKILGGELHVDDNLVGAIEGSIEINLPTAINAALKVDTPWFKSEDLKLLATYDNYSGGVKTYLQWSPTKKIEINGHVRLYDVQLTMVTPFKTIDKASIAGLLTTNAANETSFKSSVTYRDATIAGIEFNAVKNLPQNLKYNYKLITPVKGYETLSLLVAYSNNAYANGFNKNSDQILIDAKAQLQVSTMSYSLDGQYSLEQGKTANTKLTYKTNSLTIDFTVNVYQNYLSERGLTATLNTPWGKTVLSGQLNMKPNNFKFEVNLDSIELPTNPINFKVNYVSDVATVELTVGTIKRYVTLTKNTINSYNVNLVAAASIPSGEMGWNLNFDLSKTFSKFNFELKRFNLKDDQSIVYISYELTNNGQSLDAAATWMSQTVLTMQYTISGRDIEFNLRTSQPLTANRNELTLRTSKSGGILQMMLNNEMNYVKVDVSHGSTDRKCNMQITTVTPTFNIPNIKIDSTITHRDVDIIAEVKIAALDTEYKIIGKIARNQMDRSGEIQLVTPTNKYQMEVEGFFLNFNNFKGRASVTVDDKTYNTLTEVKTEGNGRRTGKFVLETPIFQKITADVYYQLSPNIEAAFSANVAGTTHKAEIKIQRNMQETRIDIVLDTPTIDIKTISVKTLNTNNGYTKSAALTSSTASHSLSLSEKHDSKSNQMRLTVDTPYLKGGQYSIAGHKTLNDGMNEMSINLNTPTQRHILKINVFRESNGDKTVKLTINSPLIGSKQIQITATLYKLDRTSFIGSLELMQGEVKHKLSADIAIKNKSVNFDFDFQTPLFNITRIQTRGDVAIINNNQLIVDMVLKKAEVLSLIKGFLKPTPTGLDGHLTVDTPVFPPLDIDMKLSCDKTKGMDVAVTFKTPTTTHGIHSNIFKKDGSYNGVLRINSPLLPGGTLSVNANIALLSPTNMQGGLTVENPGNNFKISTEYKSEPEFNRKQGYLMVMTPFDIAPYMKLRGKWSRDSSNYEGEFEIYTSEDPKPVIGIYTTQAYDANRLASAYLNIQSTMEKFHNIHLQYDSFIDETKQKSSLVLSYNQMAYGYEFENIQASRTRKINTIMYWGNRKSTFTTEMTWSQQSYMFRTMFDAQILPVYVFQYDVATKNNNKKEVTATLTVDRVKKYAFIAEFENTNVYFDGRFTINSLIKGYETITVDIFQSFSKSEQEINFKWTTNNIAMWALQFKNVFNQTEGLSNVRIQTPIESLSFYNIEYKWDVNNRQILAKSNEQTITIKLDDKSGSKSTLVELKGPITFKFSRVVEKDYRIDLSVPHPKYPINIFLQKQSNSPLSYNYLSKISWGDDDNSQLILTAKVDLVQPNYEMQISVTHPIRSLHLGMRCSRHPTITTGGVELKYDVNTNINKVIGFDFKSNKVNNEQLNEINFKYPGIKMLAIRSRSKLNVGFDHQFEVQYGLNPKEKITVEVRRENKMTEIRVTNQETNYDLQLSSNCKCNSEKHGGQFMVKYIDRYNKPQKVDFEFAILKQRPQVTFQFSTMTSTLFMGAQINPTEKGYNLTLEGRFDADKPNVIELQFKRLPGLKGVEMLIFNDNNDGQSSFSMSAGMPNDKSVRITTNRIANEEEPQKDFDFQMNLHQARELQTRFNWRPQSIKEITTQLSQFMHKACNNAETLANSMKSVGMEISSETYNMIQAMTKKINPNIQVEIDALVADLKPLFRAFNDMYANNDYYVRTFSDNISQITFHRRLMNYIADRYNQLKQSVDLKFIVTSTMNKVQQFCQYLCTDWIQTTGNQIKKLPIALLNSLNDINYWGTRFINRVVIECVTFTKNLIMNWIPPISQWKEAAPQWTRYMAIKISEQFQNYTKEFKDSKYYHQLQQSIQQLRNLLRDAYNSKYWAKVKTYSEYISSQLYDKIQTLRSYPWFQNLEIMSEKAYKLGNWAYHYLHVEEMAKQLLDTLLERASDVVIYMVEDTLFPEYQLPEMANYFIYDALRGVLEFNQTLPVAWNSFTQWPNIVGSPEYQKLGQFQKDLLELPKKTALKLYSAVKSEFNFKTTSLAFKARAVLAGNQHYVTFDGKAYEFAGACTYLLARDFVYNKFMLTVNYELENNKDGQRAIKKSFHLTLGNTTFEIRPDLTIISDNKQVETPSAIDTAKFTRTYEVVHIVDDTKQVFLTYDRKFDVLTFEIGGFYHGKTGGLFGTYDHEHHDDLTDPAQRKVQNLEQFAASWEIGYGECKSHNNYAYHSDINSYAVQKTCKQLFDDPALIPCLRQINKESYISMCVNDVSLGLSPCVAAAVYTSVCKAQGKEVSLPESCLDCEIGGSVVPQGQQVSINGSGVPKSADVVFVLDNTWQCSTTFPNLRPTVIALSKYIEQSLTKNSVPINDNRYALVGLGGQGTSGAPQAITVNNQIFGSIHSLQMAVNSTRFSAGHHHHISEMIQYAYDLPYRPGVSKMVVVVPCSESVDNEEDYEDLIEKFKAVNFVVHSISLHDATIDEANKVKASDILGFDKDYAYTLKSEVRGNLIGDKKIRQEMKIPEGPLTNLAMDTNGSVFFASKLNNLQPATASVSNEIFARRLVLNAIPNNCQNCKCTVGPDGGPQVICSKCN
ncbi:hypothetical protein CHUAL_009385 [Chamberlinius hualienensis]